MDKPVRPYPLLSACGLNCGLCPRYHTRGSSQCPGCGGEGFYSKRPSCGVISCCQSRGGLEYCSDCEEYPCKKYQNADTCDSFITHRNMRQNFARVKTAGLKTYQTELNEKADILQTLLRDYNDGRQKSFFCLAVNLLPLDDTRQVLELLPDAGEAADSTPKERAELAARLFQEAAKRLGIELKLRKKERPAKESPQ